VTYRDIATTVLRFLGENNGYNDFKSDKKNRLKKVGATNV